MKPFSVDIQYLSPLQAVKRAGIREFVFYRSLIITKFVRKIPCRSTCCCLTTLYPLFQKRPCSNRSMCNNILLNCLLHYNLLIDILCSPKLTQAYTAFGFSAVIRQNGYLIIPGVLCLLCTILPAIQSFKQPTGTTYTPSCLRYA